MAAGMDAPPKAKAAGKAAAREAMGAGMAARPEYEDPEKGGLPAGEFEIDMANTGLVVTDPQIDFLSQDGVAWGWLARVSPSRRLSTTSNSCSRRPRR